MENSFEIAVGTTTLLDLNKSYISNLADQARQNLSEGFTDPLRLLVTAKKGVELFTQLEKVVRPYAEQEARLGKGEIYKKFGCDITERMTGVSYDFTSCDDDEWNVLNAQLKEIDAKKKEREKFLKTITKPIFDEEGIEIKPPIQKGKLGLVISIK